MTAIDVCFLIGLKSIRHASIARRMSWASYRATTRVEDIAYCLMGLFAVNMPLLYGEGERAFIRLQEEIMKRPDDQSLFAWTDQTLSRGSDEGFGMLARSPADFDCSGNFIPFQNSPSTLFSMSNKGLSMDLSLEPHGRLEDSYLAALDCVEPPNYNEFLDVYLRRHTNGNNQYTRVKAQDLCRTKAPSRRRALHQTVYIREPISIPGMLDDTPQNFIQLR